MNVTTDWYKHILVAVVEMLYGPRRTRQNRTVDKFALMQIAVSYCKTETGLPEHRRSTEGIIL